MTTSSTEDLDKFAGEGRKVNIMVWLNGLRSLRDSAFPSERDGP